MENINEVESYVVKGIVPNPKPLDPDAGIVKDLRNTSLTQEFYVQRRLAERSPVLDAVLRRIQAEVALKRLRIR